jgi:hypothetical protein
MLVGYGIRESPSEHGEQLIEQHGRGLGVGAGGLEGAVEVRDGWGGAGVGPGERGGILTEPSGANEQRGLGGRAEEVGRSWSGEVLDGVLDTSDKSGTMHGVGRGEGGGVNLGGLDDGEGRDGDDGAGILMKELQVLCVWVCHVGDLCV